MPSFAEEKILEAQGYRLIAGIDEAGRGSLAGPVVAAAVILPVDVDAHGLDQVQWALGMDESGPVEVWVEGDKFNPPTYT